MSGIQHPKWRQGLQRLLVLENLPQSGHDFIFQLPQGQEGLWYQIKAVGFKVLASAAVGNRNVMVGFSLVDPSQSRRAGFLYILTSVYQTTNKRDFNLADGLAATTAGGLAGDDFSNAALPRDLRLPAGAFVFSNVDGIDANDQLTNVRLWVQEWVYVPPVDVITGEIQAATSRIIAAVAESGKSKCALIGGQEQIGAPTG